MSNKNKYEAIIGLEVHAQLITLTKAYSSDKNLYGEAPNSLTSIISLAHPGTLPKVNDEVINHAIKLGLAVGAKIRKHNQYARKNYFYADLPKGYQITQDKTPICSGGKIKIKTDKIEKDINITRIHMEEDAGKSIHDLDPYDSLIDLNRAGVPLLEIVSEPEISSADEAYAYLNKIRTLVRYLEICDGNMEEGSLRCDANISVRIVGEKKFGTKVEIKNMNSSTNVKKAIDYEIKRQINLLESGDSVVHETRNYNALKNITLSLRHKEKANDYRYFPEPDLPPINISEEYIYKIQSCLPPLPDFLYKKFTEKYKLSRYDADILIEDKNIALYFDKTCEHTNNYKICANLIIGSIKSYLNEHAISILDIKTKAEDIAELIDLIESNKISNTAATTTILPQMLLNNLSANYIANKHNLIQESNEDVLHQYIRQAIEKYPDKVQEYKNGKKGLIGLFMGEVMKLSKGKADPKLANTLLKNILEK
tara:strand:- start:31801 stop:33246 length:1446 start_codon:yes stop_codon:yes gene_type:complete